jgi:hypothetical protein
VRTIVQWEKTRVNPLESSLESEEGYNVDLLVTYLVNPWTAAYVGYNSNYQNLDIETTPDGDKNVVRTDGEFLNDGRQFFFKLSYLHRF